MSKIIEKVRVQRINMRRTGRYKYGTVISRDVSTKVDHVDSITIGFESGHIRTFIYLNGRCTPKDGKRGDYKIEVYERITETDYDA